MAADISLLTFNTNIHQLGYADDTKFYSVVNNLSDQIKLQECIDKLHHWSITNRIKLNGLKSVHTTYVKRGRIPFNSRYFINLDVIQSKNEVKDLGVLIDSNFIFKAHIQNLQLKSARITAMAYRTKNKNCFHQHSHS